MCSPFCFEPGHNTSQNGCEPLISSCHRRSLFTVNCGDRCPLAAGNITFLCLVASGCFHTCSLVHFGPGRGEEKKSCIVAFLFWFGFLFTLHLYKQSKGRNMKLYRLTRTKWGSKLQSSLCATLNASEGCVSSVLKSSRRNNWLLALLVLRDC